MNPIALEAIAPTRLKTDSISCIPIAIPTATEKSIPVKM